MFSPRGGSAHVARALSRQLGTLGWELTLVAGSRSDRDRESDAKAFYAGIDVRPVDFAPALRSADPISFRARPGTAPMHPSFELRPGAPDHIFAALDDLSFGRQVRAWAQELERAGAASADVLYLHHLTPVNEASARVAPDVPVVGHLHGTELLMLERIERGAPDGWPFAEEWGERLREWAQGCRRLVVSPAGAARASRLLGLAPDRLLPLANGFDPQVFRPLEVDRRALWRRHLVLEPLGWLPEQEPGSIRYREEELTPLIDGTALLYVGRFTEVKRLPFLLEAYRRARPRFRAAAALVIVGGHPGEWEGEHPARTIERLGVGGVFLAGWHPQDSLPELLGGADAIVLPSAREQFGQVLVEGMACARAPIAANALGPAEIIEDGETGWLFEPQHLDGLADALVQAVNEPEERLRRAARGREAAIKRLSWPTLAAKLDEALREVIAPHPAVDAGRAADASSARFG